MSNGIKSKNPRIRRILIRDNGLGICCICMSEKETHTWKAYERDRAWEFLSEFGYQQSTLKDMIIQVVRDCSQIAADADTNFDARERILSRFGLKP